MLRKYQEISTFPEASLKFRHYVNRHYVKRLFTGGKKGKYTTLTDLQISRNISIISENILHYITLSRKGNNKKR